jgi:LPS sulfotransferase NodH
MRILHLHRLNVEQAAVSAHVSEQRKVWHSWQEGAADKASQRHVLRPERVVEDALLLQKQSYWIKKHWVGKTQYMEVTYEKLVASLTEDTGLIRNLSNFVGGEVRRPFVPKLEKLGRPLNEMVENFEALRAACEEAGLSEHL